MLYSGQKIRSWFVVCVKKRTILTKKRKRILLVVGTLNQVVGGGAVPLVLLAVLLSLVAGHRGVVSMDPDLSNISLTMMLVLLHAAIAFKTGLPEEEEDRRLTSLGAKSPLIFDSVPVGGQEEQEEGAVFLLVIIISPIPVVEVGSLLAHRD